MSGPSSEPPAGTTATPRKSRRVLRYVLAFVSCVVVIDAVVGEKGLVAMFKARQQYQLLEQSLIRVRSENAALREEARRLREDPRTIEDIARRELGLMKPGEKLFILKDIKPKE